METILVKLESADGLHMYMEAKHPPSERIYRACVRRLRLDPGEDTFGGIIRRTYLLYRTSYSEDLKARIYFYREEL